MRKIPSVGRIVEVLVDVLLGAIPATCLLPMPIFAVLIVGHGKGPPDIFVYVFLLLCVGAILGTVGLWIAALTPRSRFMSDHKRRVWVSSMMIMGITSLSCFAAFGRQERYLVPYAALIIPVAIKHVVMMIKYENAANKAL